MFLKILIAIAILLAVLTVVIATQPAEFRYTRSMAIAAPPEALFDQINDLKKFQTWNPWAKVDPNSTITYSGPATGVDSSYAWKGNKEVGEGRMTIIESKPNELVRARMEFLKPFAATHTAEFAFKLENGQTTVSWSLYGQNNFMGKAMSLFIDCDKMCGDQFLQGLATLKANTEK